jgi:hypothetical protein
VDDAVAVDVARRRITSRGPATSMAFAVALLGAVASLEKALEVADGLLLPRGETEAALAALAAAARE